MWKRSLCNHVNHMDNNRLVCSVIDGNHRSTSRETTRNIPEQLVIKHTKRISEHKTDLKIYIKRKEKKKKTTTKKEEKFSINLQCLEISARFTALSSSLMSLQPKSSFFSFLPPYISIFCKSLLVLHHKSNSDCIIIHTVSPSTSWHPYQYFTSGLQDHILSSCL